MIDNMSIDELNELAKKMNEESQRINEESWYFLKRTDMKLAIALFLSISALVIEIGCIIYKYGVLWAPLQKLLG